MRDRHDQTGQLLAALAPRLHHFVAVARSEHMTRAGQALGVPQPTLSRSIARLEEQLGVSLFLRQGRTVRLSRAGRVLLQHVERGLAELETGLRAAIGDVSPESGSVALGFLHTLGSSVVPRLIKTFRDQHPGIRFELVQGSHDLLLSRLRDGGLDLCLTSPLPEDEPGLTTQAMQDQELLLVVPHEHAFAGRGTVRLAEAAAEPFVGLERGYGLRRITDGWCRQAGFVPQLAFTGEEIDTVRGLVAAGLGVALLPPHDGAPAPDTVELTVTQPHPTRRIGLVWLDGRAEPAPVRAFRRFVLAAGPQLLQGRPPRPATSAPPVP